VVGISNGFGVLQNVYFLLTIIIIFKNFYLFFKKA
jgi:hypothetical protein